jgi:hypothetical protein
MDARPPKKYEDVEEIKDVDGVVVVITRHRATGKLGAGFFKVFDRSGDGDVEKTAFLSERHLDAVSRLVPIVRARMVELRKNG